jgi:hypothetical protein
MLRLFTSISINGNSENSGLSSRFERGKLWHVISKAQLDFIASLTITCPVFFLNLFPLFQFLSSVSATHLMGIVYSFLLNFNEQGNNKLKGLQPSDEV